MEMPNLLPSYQQIEPFLPEVALIAATLAVLLIPVFSPRKNILAVAITTTVGLAVALIGLIYTRSLAMTGHTYFGGMLVLDPFAWFVKLLLIIFTGLVMALWFVDSHRRMVSRGQSGDAPEFFTLLLAATTGMMLMTGTTNLLMMFLALEMSSLPSYVLAGFRKTHRPGAEAALKYVLFGAASSAIMLYGMSLLFGLFGTLDLAAMHPRNLMDANRIVLVVGVVGLLVGIGFKIAMVPVHFWCPDVFEGTSIDITTWLSVASKAAGLALLMRVLTLLMHGGDSGDAWMRWLPIALLILGGITCFWGNLGAYPQQNIKRLLAFSSIVHSGYMLVALAAVIMPGEIVDGGETAQMIKGPAADALLFYLFMYVFMNAGAFMTAAAIAQRIATPTSSGERLDDYAGLARRAPILAGAMLLFCLSLTGMPLTIGFATKIKLFSVLYNTGQGIGWIGVGVVGINTVMGAFYYFRIIKQMYLVQTDLPRVIEIAPATVLSLVLAVPNVAFFLGYNWIDEVAHRHCAISLSLPAEQLPQSAQADVSHR